MTTEHTPKPKCDLCADQPSDDVLYLHARCHMTAPLQASREGETLILRCYIPECRREVARFSVVSTAAIALAREALSQISNQAVTVGMENPWNGAACRIARRALAALGDGK